MDISYFLKMMVEQKASDMFLSSGAPVSIKVEGKIHPLGRTGLPAEVIQQISYGLMDENQIAQFEAEQEMNLAINLKNIGRFRINVFRQRGEVAMVIRTIQTIIPSLEDLNLPMMFQEIAMRRRGLVLVVGSTGSGKSTTLASMIDYRNTNSVGHILTIEDPIEFIHHHKQSIINQREVGIDTKSYHNALKNAMREAPDVILIGEILDVHTLNAALSYAETGHLCFATFHANNADQTIGRILNFYDKSAHEQILMDLSLNLVGILSQRLVYSKKKKRVPAIEVLLNTSRIADLIRRGELHQLKEAMEKSLDDDMQTFDQSLYQLYQDGIIELEEALDNADSKDALQLKINLASGSDADVSSDYLDESIYG